MIAQAFSGLMSVTGAADGPPTKAGTSVGDITGGLFTALGIASALYHREQTGHGMRIDVSMVDGQVAILEAAVMRYTATGEVPGRAGNRHPSICPFESYQTADQPIIIACGNDSLFVRLCQALGLSHLCDDPRFRANSTRVRHMDGLGQALEEVLKTQPSAHWLELLETAGVPCSPINTVADAIEHPQVQARNMIVDAGGLRVAGNPIKMNVFPDPPTRRPAPALDADGKHIREEFA
jgi:CoA:oxalate CoA-transferase